jgi:hypothetical protein
MNEKNIFKRHDNDNGDREQCIDSQSFNSITITIVKEKNSTQIQSELNYIFSFFSISLSLDVI